MLRSLGHVPVGTVYYTPALGVIAANKDFAEIVGRTVSEVLGMHMEDLTHPDDWNANRWLLSNALRTGEPFALNKRYLLPNGDAVWVENFYQVLESPAQDTSIILMSRRLDALPAFEPTRAPAGTDYGGFIYDMCLQLSGMAAATGRVISSDLLRLAAKVDGVRDTPA